MAVDMYEFLYDLKMAKNGETSTVEHHRAMMHLLHKVARFNGTFELNPLKIAHKYGFDSVKVATVARWLVGGGFFVQSTEPGGVTHYSVTEKCRYWLALPNKYIHERPKSLV